MADSRLVLVTGATGALGPSIVHAAIGEGRRVRTLTRRPPDAGVLPSHTDVRIGDVCDERARRTSLEGVDQIIHLAALLHVPERRELRAAHETINASATAALVRDAAAAGVRRIVLFSSIVVYGETGGGTATEATPVAPATAYARSKVHAEEVVLGGGGACVGVVLRLAAAYGPRVKGNYRSLVRRLASGRSLPILPGSNRRTLIFEEDAARAAMLASDHAAAAGQVFNVTDGRVYTVAQITAAICAALGRSGPAFGIPAAAARAALRPLRSLPGPLGAVATLVEKYTEDAAVDGSRIQNELGFTPVVQLEEGWRRTVAAMRQCGF
jgi:UDP-N-acetyl-alpha-D-quinovosamine dehydrogenase